MSIPGTATFDLDRRGCVQCPSTTPSCDCDVGTKCQISVLTCDSCQFTYCVPDTTTSAAATTSATSSSSKPNVGAIAGGVIGGVFAIALLVYLVWKFCIKAKRQQFEGENWEEFTDEPTEAEKEFTLRRDARASTHTVGSIASTVLTRASNIIQIAYIPGVTNRSAPSTPGLLVPPVPPIPIALSSTNTPSYEDQHFFMPGDLRDSTYSAMTTMTDRTSYAPRSSVASTIYGKNAVVSPVTQVIRGKAAVVSVKHSGSNSPGELTPPVPDVDYNKYNNFGPPSPAFSVGSTFLNSATAATQMRPQVVKVSSNLKLRELRNQSDTQDDSSQSSGARESHAVTVIDDTPSVDQGPFGDPPSREDSHTRSGSLSAVIEEATRKAHGDVRAGLGLKRDETPFGDENSTNE